MPSGRLGFNFNFNGTSPRRTASHRIVAPTKPNHARLQTSSNFKPPRTKKEQATLPLLNAVPPPPPPATTPQASPLPFPPKQTEHAHTMGGGCHNR